MYDSDFDLHIFDLSPHLNIIFGPNGSGKTTLANALNGFLLPRVAASFKLYAQANLSFGHKTLYLNVKNQRAESKINGRIVERSDLTQFLRPKSHHLSLQELLPELSGDSDLAQEIIRQANGGFDIGEAGKNLQFKIQKRYSRSNESSEFRSARDQLRKIVNEQRSLRDQKDLRAALQDELEEAKLATKQVALIEKIQIWNTAKKQYQEALEYANGFPRVICSSDDLKDVTSKMQKLDTLIHQLKKDVDRRTETIQDLQVNLAGNPLAPNGLQPGDLKLLDSQVRDYVDQFRELSKLNETYRSAKEQGQEIWESLGGFIDEDWEPKFTLENLRDLQKFAKDSGSYALETESLEQLKLLLGAIQSGDSHMDSNELRDLQRILLQGIQALESDSPRSRKAHSLVLITIILSAVLSIGAGVVLDPLAYSGLIISALNFWIYTLLRSQKQQRLSATQKKNLKNLLPELSSTPDLDQLYSELDRLLEARAKGKLEELKSNEQSRIDHFLENLKPQKAELETRRDRLIASLHLETPPNQITSLIELVDRILNWRKFDFKAKELGHQYKIASQSCETAMDIVGESFEQYGYERPTDPRDAERLLDKLRHDDNAAKRDHDRLELEQASLESDASSLQEKNVKYEKVFTDLELDVGDFTGLSECERQFAAWIAASSRANDLRIFAESKALHQDLPSEYEPLLQLVNLEDEQRSAQQKSATQDHLQERLTRLDADIERAEQGNSLERALADQENKRIALEVIREEKAAKAIGQAILTHLSESAIQNAPLVFEKAKKNFQQVTDGRYSLIIPQNDSFRARDHHRKRDFDLSELSSATRVQLLLSVRLAFVETQETNYRLPITLDETLANSDDQRAQAIIQTMSSLAADRQIFYFTAQQDEVDKWGDFVPKDLLKVHTIG